MFCLLFSYEWAKKTQKTYVPDSIELWSSFQFSVFSVVVFVYEVAILYRSRAP